MNNLLISGINTDFSVHKDRLQMPKIGLPTVNIRKLEWLFSISDKVDFKIKCIARIKRVILHNKRTVFIRRQT